MSKHLSLLTNLTKQDSSKMFTVLIETNGKKLGKRVIKVRSIIRTDLLLFWNVAQLTMLKNWCRF